MSEQIKVSKIEIKIGKQVISLTPDELKELKNVLEAAFPEKEVIKWIPQAPIIIDRPIYPKWPYWDNSPTFPNWPNRWDITCSSSSKDLGETVCLSLNNAQ